MKSLTSRENHPAVWDSVNWELSTTYFTLATLLQDYAPLSRKAQEQVGWTAFIAHKTERVFQINFDICEFISHWLPYLYVLSQAFLCWKSPHIEKIPG